MVNHGTTSCLDLIDAQLDHLRATMSGMAADALGQQLFDLLSKIETQTFHEENTHRIHGAGIYANIKGIY